ncbi:Gfo/Idh/MocA family protein [Flavimarina sp. Hel_I_48]|uniref:Gfo/Idh/MocA family protein n=1 Tax=Flavimarina sp. Hel_I_48 TaxID=1392488 RepID=UPI0009DE811A|nr:Gfo/Idh/MocA family oxidoreductase [Flavimarina sp. Hel_I_48]
MANLPKFNIALIGLGAIAQKAYLPILANHPRVSPILCTRDKSTLNQLSNRYRIDACYTEIDEIVELQPDAVMVHSATESHFALVTKLLQEGIPTFVDKPLTYTLEETKKLLLLAEDNKTPLYLGFNRRFAPLVADLKNQEEPIQILWQKNRVNLPGDPRTFIFDDFIHVVDSLRFLARGEVKNLQVFPRLKKGLLESIHVTWQQNETVLSGTMNRVNGITEECIEFYSPGNKILLDGLDTGWHYQKGKAEKLVFDNWQTTLYKRGFVNMIDDFLNVIDDGSFNAERNQDILKTHQLCEEILSLL